MYRVHGSEHITINLTEQLVHCTWGPENQDFSLKQAQLICKNMLVHPLQEKIASLACENPEKK